KNQHLLLLLLASTTLIGCDTHAKTSKGYSYSGGYEFNGYTPPKYEPKLEFPAYKLPEPKCSEFDIPKHEPLILPDLFEDVAPFYGHSLRTIQTDVGPLSVRI